MLKRVDPQKPRGALYRAYTRVSATRPGMWLSRRVLWKLDPVVMRITGGRVGLTPLVPRALLETRGAKTGAPRHNVVIYFNDGDDVIVVPSKLGAPENPGWFYNACANPDVTMGGAPFRAEVVSDETERTRLWALGDQVFPPYAIYRERAAATGRTIPILRLRPR